MNVLTVLLQAPAGAAGQDIYQSSRSGTFHRREITG